MKDQYTWTINSPQDLDRALAEADRGAYELTFYTSRFDLRGTSGSPISVDGRLENLYVVAHGPAPVYVEGSAAVQAVGSAVVYATAGSTVDAYDTATVYAYDDAQVDVSMDAAVYAASDDVDINAYGSGRVYLPSEGAGARASVHLHDATAKMIRAASSSSSSSSSSPSN